MKTTASQLLNFTKTSIHGDPSSIIFCPFCSKAHKLEDLLKMVDMGLEELVVCDCDINKPKTTIPKQYHTGYQKYLESVAKNHYINGQTIKIDEAMANEMVDAYHDNFGKTMLDLITPVMKANKPSVSWVISTPHDHPVFDLNDLFDSYGNNDT